MGWQCWDPSLSPVGISPLNEHKIHEEERCTILWGSKKSGLEAIGMQKSAQCQSEVRALEGGLSNKAIHRQSGRSGRRSLSSTIHDKIIDALFNEVDDGLKKLKHNTSSAHSISTVWFTMVKRSCAWYFSSIIIAKLWSLWIAMQKRRLGGETGELINSHEVLDECNMNQGVELDTAKELNGRLLKG